MAGHVSTSPLPGQAAFGEVFDAVPPQIDLSERVPFATVARPEFWHIDAEPYGVVTPRMIGAISAHRIRPTLLGVEGRGIANVVDGIALTDVEYGTVMRSPNAGYYTSKIEAQSRKHNALMPHDRRQEVAREDVITGLGRMIGKMEVYRGETLAPNQRTLARVHEAATHPGLRRRRNLVTIGEVVTVKDHIFPQMLSVVGTRRGWTAEQADLAAKSLTASLFFFRSGNKHLTAWRDWLRLGIDHTREKGKLYDKRIVLAKRALDEFSKQA